MQSSNVYYSVEINVYQGGSAESPRIWTRTATSSAVPAALEIMGDSALINLRALNGGRSTGFAARYHSVYINSTLVNRTALRPLQSSYTFDTYADVAVGSLLGFAAVVSDVGYEYHFIVDDIAPFYLRNDSGVVTTGNLSVLIGTNAFTVTIASVGVFPTVLAKMDVIIKVQIAPAKPVGTVCSSTGDPHFVTFDTSRFDFYGIGA